MLLFGEYNGSSAEKEGKAIQKGLDDRAIIFVSNIMWIVESADYFKSDNLLFKDSCAQNYNFILRQGCRFGCFEPPKCCCSTIFENFKLYLIFDVRCKFTVCLCSVSL